MNKILYILLLIFLNQVVASACSCDDTSLSLKDSYQFSDYIIHGRVLKKESVSFLKTISKRDLNQLKNSSRWDNKINEIESFEVIKVEIQVVKAYKGKFKKKKVTVYTSKHNQSCGFQLFSEGYDFIIYGVEGNYLRSIFGLEKSKNRRNTFWTSQCSRTMYYNTQENESLCKLLNH